ncbi:hypothetical protein A4X13_0g9182 [Tilletia indica]|uniref:Uncharacterized protein n=1 Tax=Tilletia indica TaxID=43049 RepID=A0A177T1Z2_9BASI|nr:hypothetical protein A4X13_0g9182 [Tilletia indica]
MLRSFSSHEERNPVRRYTIHAITFRNGIKISDLLSAMTQFAVAIRHHQSSYSATALPSLPPTISMSPSTGD